MNDIIKNSKNVIDDFKEIASSEINYNNDQHRVIMSACEDRLKALNEAGLSEEASTEEKILIDDRYKETIDAMAESEQNRRQANGKIISRLADVILAIIAVILAWIGLKKSNKK